MRRCLAFLVVGVVVLGAAACSSSKRSTAPTSTPGPATTLTTSSSPGSTTTSTPQSSLRCHTSELRGELGQPSPGAGQIYTPLVLRNAGSRTCTVSGYPGVSLLNAAGAQIGGPAGREPGQTVIVVTLAPGATASSAIHTQNPGIAPPTCLAPSAQVRVYPPDELDALTVPGVLQICGGTFTVGRLVPGATGVAP